MDASVTREAALVQQSHHNFSRKRPNDTPEEAMAHLPHQLSQLSVHQRKRSRLHRTDTGDELQSNCPWLRDTKAQRRIRAAKRNERPTSPTMPSPRRSLVEIDGNSLHPTSSALHSDKTSSLEGLPTEIKLTILKTLPNMDSVDALIRASPLYSRAYFDIQEEIFNVHTIKVLARRGVDILPLDIESPSQVAWLEVSIIGGGPSPPGLGAAILAFYDGWDKKNHGRLSISHCRALLAVADVVGWKSWTTTPVFQKGPILTFDGFGLNESPTQYVDCPPEKIRTAYSRGFAHYHTYVFPSESLPSFTLPQVELFRSLFMLLNQGVANFGPFRLDSTHIHFTVNASATQAQIALAMGLGERLRVVVYVKAP